MLISRFIVLSLKCTTCLRHTRLIQSLVSLLLSVSSHLRLCPGSADITRKLPVLLGLDPLAIHRALSHWACQVRNHLSRIVPHLQWHPPLGKTFIITFIHLANVYSSKQKYNCDDSSLCMVQWLDST